MKSLLSGVMVFLERLFLNISSNYTIKTYLYVTQED